MKHSNTHRINWYYYVVQHSEADELKELWNELLKIQLQNHLGVNSLQAWDSVLQDVNTF